MLKYEVFPKMGVLHTFGGLAMQPVECFHPRALG